MILIFDIPRTSMSLYPRFVIQSFYRCTEKEGGVCEATKEATAAAECGPCYRWQDTEEFCLFKVEITRFSKTVASRLEKNDASLYGSKPKGNLIPMIGASTIILSYQATVT